MMRTQITGLLLTLAGSGCAIMAPSGMQVTPAGMVPGHDALGQDIDLLFNCRFDPDAEQMSHDDFRPGQEVQIITVDRRVRKKWGTEEVSRTMTLYVGTVESVDGEKIVLKDVVRMVEGRTESGVPMLQSVPYLSRMFRNSGIGRTSSRMPDNVTIPREKIGGAFELSPSGIDKLAGLRKGEEADSVLETSDALPVPALQNQSE
jgi:hypothetical protein